MANDPPPPPPPPPAPAPTPEPEVEIRAARISWRGTMLAAVIAAVIATATALVVTKIQIDAASVQAVNTSNHEHRTTAYEGFVKDADAFNQTIQAAWLDFDGDVYRDNQEVVTSHNKHESEVSAARLKVVSDLPILALYASEEAKQITNSITEEASQEAYRYSISDETVVCVHCPTDPVPDVPSKADFPLLKMDELEARIVYELNNP